LLASYALMMRSAVVLASRGGTIERIWSV
jgi:hypothetical protein